MLNREHRIGLVCMGAAAFVLSITPSFPEGQDVNLRLTGPAFFPNLLSYGLIAAGVYQLVRGFARQTETEGEDETEVNWRLVAVVVALLVAYVGLFEVLGFAVNTFAFLVALMLVLGVRPIHAGLYGVGFTFVIWVMFGVLFTISIPVGILRYIGY